MNNEELKTFLAEAMTYERTEELASKLIDQAEINMVKAGVNNDVLSMYDKILWIIKEAFTMGALLTNSGRITDILAPADTLFKPANRNMPS